MPGNDENENENEDGDGDADADTGPDLDPDASATPEPEPACPFCGSTDTDRHSRFGSEVSKSQYYCNGCNTIFERIKYDGDLPDTGR